MSTVGFIGLGTMGRPMAKNLMEAGHELVFLARRPEVVEEFSKAGARQAATPAEVLTESEFVITIVPTDTEVEQVVLGPDGIVEAAVEGKTLIDMSTISPSTTRKIGTRLHHAGMAMVDAPVSGGPWGAEAAKLTIMVGGDEKDVERCKPLFEAMGDKIFHVGPLASGQTVKLVNQMIAAGVMALIGEGFVLAKAAGVDLEQLVDVMSVSSGNSAMLEARGKKFVLANNFEPGFKTHLMRKDIGLAIRMGQNFDVPLPVAAAAFQQYTAALNQGFAAEDFASVVKVCQQAAGVKVVDDK